MASEPTILRPWVRPAAADDPREPAETPPQRLARLQRELRSEVDSAAATLCAEIDSLRARLEEARDYPLPPGLKDDFRKLAEAMTATLTRAEAVRGRA